MKTKTFENMRRLFSFIVYAACSVVTLVVLADFPEFLRNTIGNIENPSFADYSLICALVFLPIMPIVTNIEKLKILGVLFSLFDVALLMLLMNFWGAAYWSPVPIIIFNTLLVWMNPDFDGDEYFTSYVLSYIVGYLLGGFAACMLSLTLIL